MKNPARSISGIAHQVNLAPPVSQTSTRFITASILIMEIKDIPRAVLRASDIPICRDRIIVSRIIEVNRPLIIAKTMIVNNGQTMPLD